MDPVLEAADRWAIHRCARTNARYMRDTPAGRHYPSLVRLYNRIADQGVECAWKWANGLACPRHGPATDAFWWAVAHWCRVFTADLLRLSPRACALGRGDLAQVHHELQEVFCAPHLAFAQYLRPEPPARTTPWRLLALWRRVTEYDPPVLHGVTPGRLIILHDCHWTLQVLRLTARWGLVPHLKDLPALAQTVYLLPKLRDFVRGKRAHPVALAYLESDLDFLAELFGHFRFTDRSRIILESFLADAQKDLEKLR